MARTLPGGAAPRARAEWTRRPERSNPATLRLMTWLSLHLGRRTCRLLLRLITAYFLLFAPVARRASRAYLGRVLGRRPRLAEIAAHLFSFAATIHDRVYLLAGRFELFDIDIEGEALMLDLLARRQGALLFGAHLGSFEVTRALGRRHPGLRIVLTMYEDNARKVQEALAAVNPAAQPEIIPLGHLDTMLRVRDAVGHGALVGLLADRSLGDEATLAVPLLGSPAAIPTGPFRMAAMLREPVIFMAGLYLGGNRYRIRFETLADFSAIGRDAREAAIAAAVRAYAERLEECCRQAPYNWFNFFDFWQASAPADRKAAA